MRRLLRRASIVAGAFLALACGGDSATGVNGQVRGTWNLQTVNGGGLPFIIAQSGADRYELVSDQFEFSADGSFSEIAVLRFTEGGITETEQVSDFGTYTTTGTAVTLRYSDGYVSTGAFSGSQLTMTSEGLALVYRRE